MDGGGALMNQGVHGIDMILWLARDVESVFARTTALARKIQVEDTAIAVLKYRNGAFGIIEGITSVYPAQETRFEIHGENGSIIFGDSGFKQWRTEADEKDVYPRIQNIKLGGSADPRDISSEGHYILIDDMINAIYENRDPMITGEEARRAVNLILSIYKSAETGKEVFLDK